MPRCLQQIWPINISVKCLSATLGSLCVINSHVTNANCCLKQAHFSHLDLMCMHSWSEDVYLNFKKISQKVHFKLTWINFTVYWYTLRSGKTLFDKFPFIKLVFYRFFSVMFKQSTHFRIVKKYLNFSIRINLEF